MVVGFDAAEREIVLDLAAKGLLPNVQSLIDRGACTAIANQQGFFVSATWPSIVTGMPAAEHGRFSGIQIRPGTYGFEKYSLRDLQGEPFWSVLGNEGRRCAIVDVPHSELVDNLNGLQISGWGTHDGSRILRTYPSELATAVIDRIGPYPARSCGWYARRGGFRHLQTDLIAAVSRKADLAEYLLAQEKWDLFMVVFHESHCVGHVAWHLHDERHPKYDAELAAAIGDPIADVYRSLDAALGRLIEVAGPDVTVVLLLSHGMGPNYQARSALDTVLLRLDKTIGDVPPFIETRTLVRRAQRGVARRARSRLHLPAPSDENVLDGSRRFFQVPNYDACGAIRFNVIDREPFGRVHPGSELEELYEWLTKELHALVNVTTGEPVVKKVMRTAEHHHGHALSRMPDLWVEWNRDAPIRTVASPTIGKVRCRGGGLQTGDHRQEGMLVAAGPSIAPRQALEESNGMQVAATICVLLDCESSPRTAPPIGFAARTAN